MKNILSYIIVFIVCTLAVIYFGSEQEKVKPDRTQIVLDSVKAVIDKKDSVILEKEKRFQANKLTDSLAIYNINKSIKNLYYEVKKQNQVTYSMPDSIFVLYIDSIRADKGFYRIQY